MRRFFAEINPEMDSVVLSTEDSNHIVNVLRLERGAQIVVCDGRGIDYLCEISQVTKGMVVASILSSSPCCAEPQTQITLFQGLPKADKMELIIQKCVEIGVFEIVPVITERTIVKLNGKETAKIARWQKIAESAAKQAGRGIIPCVGEVATFRQSLEVAQSFENKIVAYENEKNFSIKEYLIGAAVHGVPSLALFIGPEGGFSDKEAQTMANSEIAHVSLGKRILRTETAGMAALTAVLYELGDM